MNPLERTRDLARAVVVALAVFLSSLATAHAQPLYQGADTGSHRLTILGTWESFFAYALNDIGDVLGSSLAPDGSRHIVRWDGKRLVDLGPGVPGDIDNRRRVVGGHQAETVRAALWDWRRFVLLETESYYSMAHAISRAGHIAGYTITPSPIATLWYGDRSTDLWRGYAYAVNGLGMAAGVHFSDDQAGNYAVIGDGANMTTLGNANSFAAAINERGEVVGEDNARAFLWKRGLAVELKLPAGNWTGSSAADINEFGTIVGWHWGADKGGAMRWTDPAQPGLDLNTLLSPEDVAAGWILGQAIRVNRQGSVLGYASNPSRCFGCAVHSFLLERND